jgi:hypothetical protein
MCDPDLGWPSDDGKYTVRKYYRAVLIDTQYVGPGYALMPFDFKAKGKDYDEKVVIVGFGEHTLCRSIR